MLLSENEANRLYYNRIYTQTDISDVWETLNHTWKWHNDRAKALILELNETIKADLPIYMRTYKTNTNPAYLYHSQKSLVETMKFCLKILKEVQL
mgnify:CR=1 FL=1